MSMTIDQFGQTIKNKYPQYNDIPNEELGMKMLEKFPQYGNLLTQDNAEKKVDRFVESQPVVSKIGSFLGIESFGKGIGQAIFFNLTSEGRNFLKDVKSGKIDARDADQFFRDQPLVTKKEVIGSAAQTALNIGTAGLGGGSMLSRVGQGGAIAAGLGAAKSFEQDGSAKDIARDAFVSGLTGSVTVGALSVLGKGIQAGLSKAPDKLYNSALHVSQKLIEAKKSPAKLLADKKLFGTTGSLLRQVKSGIEKSNSAIKSKLSNSTAKVSSSEIVEEAKIILKKKLGAVYNESDIDKAIKNAPVARLREKVSMTLEEANELRQQLDKILGERFFISDSQAAFSKEVGGTISNVLRKKIQGLSGTQKEFAELSVFLRAERLLNKSIAQADKRIGIGLTDIILGSAFGFGGGGIPGAATAVGVKKVAESTLGRTSAAVVISQLNKAIQSAPVDASGKVSKAFILNLVKELTVPKE